MIPNGLIEERNKDLWKFLSKVHDIKVEFEDYQNYSVASKSNSSTIFINKNDINSASFTHELLHVFLRTKKVFAGAAIINEVKSNSRLNLIFSEGLLDHLGNCLEHIKMLPIFLSLGYERHEFVSDYETKYISNLELLFIRIGFGLNKLNLYNAKSINSYIGLYISARADANDSINYEIELKQLRKVSPELYEILENLIEDWNRFDFESEDILVNGYHMLVFNFSENLNNWLIDKKLYNQYG